MKNRLMVLALVGMAGQSLAGGVFISEYIEGSSNSKAVEIVNVTGAPVSLANYQLWRGWNGGGWTSFTTLAGTLANNDVYVLANGGSAAAILAVTDQVATTIINWNGNDAVGLAEWDGSAFVLVDVIGTPSIDPGAAGWTVNGVAGATVDNTLVRNASVCEGTTDWAVANLQYTVLDNNVFTNLGSHVSTCGGNLPPAVSGVSYTPNPAYEGNGLTFTCTATDSDGTVSLVVLNYGSTAGNLNQSVTLDPLGGGVYSNSSAITAPGPCEQLFYQIVATDDDSDTGSTAVLGLTVFCELTIDQIQGGVSASPYVGQVVHTEGQVSFVQSGTSLFLQDSNDPWHGIQVFGTHPSSIVEGDYIKVTGSILEYNGFTEIAGTLSFEVLASPGPLTIVPQLLTLGGALSEAYEGMLVRVENVTCVGSVDPNTYMFDGVDQMLVYAPGFTGVEDACYNVAGVRYAYQGTPEISIRTLADITECFVVDAREELRFSLAQAWPNPFNPTAQISFNLDRTAPARLSVFNVLGQEVAVLVDGMLDAGAHQVTFDAAGQPSGLYFYSLQSEGRQLTGRMTLVR